MKLEQIREVIDNVIGDIPFMYDLSVTTPPSELVTQRAQDHFNRGKPESLNQTYQLDNTCKSVIVWNVFSRVAYDYHYKNNFLPEIIRRLNTLYNYNFGYDDYLLNRKQFAIRSGAATLAKTSLAFHKRFGMNYKIDLIFTNAEFDETIVIDGEPHYSNCIGCDAPCEYKCPMGCTMNFDLVDWEKCSNFVDVPEAFKDLDSICRICQDSCPYSQELTKRILEINPRYGERIHATFT
jgi:hypothetical protein|tara:strand:+ start:4682 stop:5392 length:711 start_codon:yes stop_codon:yes gene_type:complete